MRKKLKTLKTKFLSLFKKEIKEDDKKVDVAFEEWVDNWKKQKKELHEFRGEVLSKSVYIETLLGFILAECLARKGMELEFRRILNKEFFTFMQKVKIFSGLQIHKHAYFKNKYTGYSGKLFEIIEFRNAFAHGYLDIEGKVIDYRQGEQERTLEITPEFQKKFFEKINALDEMLVAVYGYLRDKKEKEI